MSDPRTESSTKSQPPKSEESFMSCEIIPMELSQFFKLASQLGLMTTSYGGEMVIAADGHDVQLTWRCATPFGGKLDHAEALIPERYLAEAKQIVGVQA
ncbi:hypothetical protein PU634_10420 [Oceanimonas pelagia]|uniref:Uncharacterized protein n=1 Tax=Oceanimonas pelagia TaxID=3028314 RepID=A0AA50KM72_9GAMM|nr:hypothetical protein [Oceanimonas pelagia]WMC09530.1 hypothetical protein PU634_10420 [Oceanimonas pelagia]